MTRHDFQLLLREAQVQQPERLPEISRGLSKAIPPVSLVKFQHPEGVQELFGIRAVFCDPFRVVSSLCHYRGYRRVAPQPPANFWQAAGLLPV